MPVKPAQPGRKYPQAAVQYYFDADIMGLAKVVAGLRSDVTYPGDPGGVVRKRQRPPSPITDPSIKDSVWIPEVTRRGWLVVTRDSKIQDHRAEIAAVRDSGARMVALNGAEATGVWDQLEVLMSRWRSIEALITEPGPFIYVATRTRLRAVDLA